MYVYILVLETCYFYCSKRAVNIFSPMSPLSSPFLQTPDKHSILLTVPRLIVLITIIHAISDQNPDTILTMQLLPEYPSALSGKFTASIIF